MKAVVWHGVGDIRLDEVPDPQIEAPTDAVVRLIATALCGTDLHLIRGTMPGMQPGTILGHEGVGVVEQVGSDVRNLNLGDRVVIPSTIGCGYCSYCRAGSFNQCDNASPSGHSFFGGGKDTGPYNGLQAERARIPFAYVNLVKLPASITDNQAIMISDIFPTGYFGADIADITVGDTVAVFGCGPVGQFTIASAMLLGAGRVLAVDTVPSRLEMARAQGAEVIDYNADDPVATIQRLTGGIGVDRVIDAVGVDANRPDAGPAAAHAEQQAGRFAQELDQIVPQANPQGDSWHPGNAPSQALDWAVQAVAKAGTVAIIGNYPQTMQAFPIGAAMNKNLTIKMGSCPHRKYIPQLIELVASGAIDPESILTQVEPMTDVLHAYQAFDQRQPGWIKVELVPGL